MSSHRSTKDPNAALRSQLPLLGGLLRLTHQEFLNVVGKDLEEAGLGDVRPPHYAVTQQLAGRPDGVRLTELASYAGVTKPSMSALVDGLQEGGYVERVADPEDQRAQRIRLTARGRRFVDVALRAVRKMEARWADRIGARDVETLRRLLRALVESRPPLEHNQ